MHPGCRGFQGGEISHNILVLTPRSACVLPVSVEFLWLDTLLKLLCLCRQFRNPRSAIDTPLSVFASGSKAKVEDIRQRCKGFQGGDSEIGCNPL